MKCRFCSETLHDVFVDLVNAPLSNGYLKQNQLNDAEVFYPLKVYVCASCKLVQLDEYKKYDDIFDQDYAYFSSFSSSWLAHAKHYVELMIQKLGLTKESLVTEIASNDGYLLQYFQQEKIPCIGIEPTANTAKVARDKGLTVIEDFFSEKLAKNIEKSDLILGNNVLAHVPDINGFVAGLKIALKQQGTITMEFPHLLKLIQENQFDTIYHEHFSYLSFITVNRIFQAHDLIIYDVEKLPTHGGSLRIYAKHIDNQNLEQTESVQSLLQEEDNFGLNDINHYLQFQQKADKVKNDFVAFLIQAKQNGKIVVGYGAAAKGNTLLNYAGIKSDLIKFVVDKSPHKQGKYLPASHIPIVDESEIARVKPDYIVILPWNIQDEIIEQLAYVKEWQSDLVVAVPKLRVICAS